jgi:hypothetical protein
MASVSLDDTIKYRFVSGILLVAYLNIMIQMSRSCSVFTDKLSDIITSLRIQVPSSTMVRTLNHAINLNVW